MIKNNLFYFIFVFFVSVFSGWLSAYYAYRWYKFEQVQNLENCCTCFEQWKRIHVPLLSDGGANYTFSTFLKLNRDSCQIGDYSQDIYLGDATIDGYFVYDPDKF